MRSLWTNEKTIRNRLAARARILLLLDYDGTLAPLAPTPAQARVSRGVRESLLKLAALPEVRIAIISGRPLKDVRSSLGLRPLFYAGLHGLEISGPGLSFRHRRAAALEPVVQRLTSHFRRIFRGLPGVIIENKGSVVSIHYRGVPANRRAAFHRRMAQARSETDSRPVRWFPGHMVWEMKPAVPWNKGNAAAYLARGWEHQYPMAMGDDATDEDLFRSVNPRGISVRVGRSESSSAAYYLGDQSEVLPFLRWLAKAWARVLQSRRKVTDLLQRGGAAVFQASAGGALFPEGSH